MSLASSSVGARSRTSTLATSHGSQHTIVHAIKKPKGAFLWEGKLGRLLQLIVQAPWTMEWQITVLLSVIFVYVTIILNTYYLDHTEIWLDISLYFMELIFAADVTIHVLHAFWPSVRSHVRVYRRNLIMLVYDMISLLPVHLILIYYPVPYLGTGIRWFGIIRIYRLIASFKNLNDDMHLSRLMLYLGQYTVLVMLLLHLYTCLWYNLTHVDDANVGNYGYPAHIGLKKLSFDTYTNCFYYCACRIFSTSFGDSFPTTTNQMWMTSVLMNVGYIILRCVFIGILSLELVIRNTRRLTFVDRYHHLINYLRFTGAPESLVQQAAEYQIELWRMKDGVLSTKYLEKIPLPLQMELIFDINVGYLHNTMIFRNTGEAFLRQVALLMKHEMVLAGQLVWWQGVVKGGMICLTRGVLEMLSDEDDESPIIAFTEGTVLGELNLLYSVPAKVTLKAATYVELQVLKRTDFLKEAMDNPAILEKIREDLNQRIIYAKERQEAINSYDLGDYRLMRTKYRPMKVLKDHLYGFEDEESSFADKSHMFYKDESNAKREKFTTDYLDLYRICYNVTTIDKPHICWSSAFPWIIEPGSDFSQACDVAHFLMVLYVCFVVPYYSIFDAQRPDLEVIFTSVVRAFFILNIYIQLTTAVVNKNTRTDKVGDIASLKMSKVGFYLDLLSIFPMLIFTDSLDPQHEHVAGQIAALLPVLQFWHVPHYMDIWEKSFRSNTKLMFLIKYALIIVILSYWSGCFLYLVACPRNICNNGYWMEQLIYRETKVYTTKSSKHAKMTLTSVFFGFAVFLGAGTTDIAPALGDCLIVVCIVALGSVIACFYTANMCSIFKLSSQRRIKFEVSMRELFYFLTVNHVSAKIKERVRKFFEVQWYYNSAVTQEELFDNVSENIKQEVLSIEMVDSLLYCPLFHDCSRDFLQTVAGKVHTIVIPDDEVIQHGADIGRDMYIIQKGHCNLLDSFGTVIRTLGPTDYFGALEMMFGLPKVYTAMTSTNCILLHIEYSSLVQSLSTFPDVEYPIKAVMEDAVFRGKMVDFEIAKPMTGRVVVKKNKFTKEIKESFVLMNDRQNNELFVGVFRRLGILRYMRYMVVPVTITPYGLFLKIWCLIRFIVALLYLFTIPYNVAVSYNLMTGSLFYPMDIIVYLDIVVMCYVAYYNERSLLVTHPLLTITHYCKHAMSLDLLAVFPFELLMKMINDQINVDFYRLNRLLQVTRITGAFNCLEDNIMQIHQVVTLMKFLPMAVIVVSLATCLIYVNSCTTFKADGQYLFMANCTKRILMHDTMTNYAISTYTLTFYWMFQVFIGCSCTPVSPENSIEMLLVMWLPLCGLLYFGFMIGYVTTARSATGLALLDHTEKIKDLENFLFQENVDSQLTMKTMKYFDYVWKRTNGSNPQQICRRFNSALMEDTLVFIYEKTLREVPLFCKVERSFIRIITQHLQEMYFLRGETVIQYRDVQPYIYIIYRGKVDVLSSYNEMVTCMGSGGMFGNFTGQPISCSDVSIYASRSLDLLVIPTQTFFSLAKYYPKVLESMHKAFNIAKDYILPINMDAGDNSSSESNESEASSEGSTVASAIISNDNVPTGRMSMSTHSRSNLSQSKSSHSVSTARGFSKLENLRRPGTFLYQAFGYLTCLVATANYTLVLYGLITLNNCHTIFWTMGVFDCYFYLKVYIDMNQVFTNKRGDTILDKNRCRKRYFRNKFTLWTDIVCNLPLEPVAFIFNPLEVIHYLRVFKLGRLKYLVDFYRKTSSELTNDATALQTVITTLVLVLAVHTYACLWLTVVMITRPVKSIRFIKLLDLEHGLSMPSGLLWDYPSSLYVVSSSLTATGVDEIQLQDTSVVAVLALCLVSGKMAAAVIVGVALQMVYALRHALAAYERHTRELVDVLRNQGLSEYQLKKFWKYIRQLWLSERGRQLPVLLAQTPYVRRCDLMSAMFGQHLRNSYLFSDTGESFLRQLAVVLDYMIFFPGNYIVNAGDCEARMYWIASGSVSVVSVRSDLTEIIHEMLAEGDVFGLVQGLNKGIVHCFSYRAETKVSILILNLDAWVHILPFFPEAQKIIGERAKFLFAKI